MWKVNCWLVTMVSLWAALLQANSIAQELQTSFKPRVLYERDVEQAPRGISPEYANSYFTRINRGILTRLGTELLMPDPANSKLVIVDTKNFAETNIPVVGPAAQVQTDAQTDMIFLTTGERDNADALQTCYENLEALKNNRPQWSLTGLFHHQQVRWLNERQRFIIYSEHRSHFFVLLDQNGVKLAEHDFVDPIIVIGIDETEEGFNIFYLIKKRNTRQLALTQLDDKFKVGKTQKWPLVDRPQNVGISPLGISRSFRLRGLKSGEVTKYFLEDAPQPGYLDMNGRLPIGNFTSRWFSYANKLSAAESPLQPEIIVGLNTSLHRTQDFLLFDQQSNYYQIPDQCLTDAIFDEERKLIVTVADTKKRGTWKVRLISFE